MANNSKFSSVLLLCFVACLLVVHHLAPQSMAARTLPHPPAQTTAENGEAGGYWSGKSESYDPIGSGSNHSPGGGGPP
ncbi:unnamed protein product [Rhodiola kirilowii]